jgi:hypothetical protein
MEPSLSTELAIKAFDADAAFSTALAEFQEAPREQSIFDDAARAASHGFAWYARPSEVAAFQVVLCHKGGAEREADGQSISALLAGLLGHPLAHDVAPPPTAEPLAVDAQASEPDKICNSRITAAPAPELAAVPARSPAQLAAESLAAATGGAVVAEVVADPEPDATQLLTDEQMRVAWAPITATEVFLNFRIRKQHEIRIDYVTGDGTVKHPVWIWQLGDAIVIAHGGEAYLELARDLRRRNANRMIVFLDMTNGPGYLYLPTKIAYEQNNYQSQQSIVASGGLEIMLEVLDQAIKSL